MVAEQKVTQEIMPTALEATKAAIMAMGEAENPVKNTRPLHAAPRSGDPALKQPIFDYNATEKYQELCNIEIKVKNIFLTNRYDTQGSKRVPIALNWLGW